MKILYYRVVRWYCTSVYCIVRFIPMQQTSLTVKDSISDSPTTATTTTPDSLQSTLLPNNIQYNKIHPLATQHNENDYLPDHL